MHKVVSRLLLALVAAVVGAGLMAGPAQAAGQTQARILDSFGYGQLKLGMSEADAVATGLLTAGEPGKCAAYYFVPSEGSMPRSSGVFISKTDGVTVIGGTSKMRTPQEIWRGSTLDDLREAYPDLTQDSQMDWIYRASAPGNPAANYSFVVNFNQVQDFALEATGKGC
ncbi:hypothetical protein ACFWY9_33895 [Amycolatopsis sp. NPDC059027]|uniref:hypothetical protein n=1 Tax=unclassified Amycolatopsis TaxID=2618356 RepID=UPI00366C93AB